jgi:hypothetical protein
MKQIIAIKHVSSDISGIFEKKLNKVVEEFQNEGYLIDIQHSFNGVLFSAIVTAYRN